MYQVVPTTNNVDGEEQNSPSISLWKCRNVPLYHKNDADLSASIVTWTNRSSHPSVHTLQKWVINFQKIHGFDLKKVEVVCVFQLFKKPLSKEKIYSNPSCFGVYFHSLVCKLIDLRGRRCIVMTIFCYLSRDSLKFYLSELIVYARDGKNHFPIPNGLWFLIKPPKNHSKTTKNHRKTTFKNHCMLIRLVTWGVRG